MTPTELMDDKRNSNIPLKYLLSKRKHVSVMTVNETISIAKHLNQLLVKTAKKKDSEPSLLLINDQLDEALTYFGVWKATQRLDVYSKVCEYLGQFAGTDKDAALRVLIIVGNFSEPRVGHDGLSCIDRGIFFKPRETILPDDSAGISLLTNKRHLLLLLAGNAPEKASTLTYNKIPPGLRTPQLLAFSEYQRIKNSSAKRENSLDYEMVFSKDNSIKAPPFFYGMLSLLKDKMYRFHFEYTDSFEKFFSTVPAEFLTEDFSHLIDSIKKETNLQSVLNCTSELNKSLVLSDINNFIAKKGGMPSGHTECLNMFQDFIQVCMYSDACFGSLDALCHSASRNPSSLFKRIDAELLLLSIIKPFGNVDNHNFDLFSLFSQMQLNKPGLGIAEIVLCCVEKLGDDALKYAQLIASLPISTLCTIFSKIDRLLPAVAASIYMHAHRVAEDMATISPYFYRNELAKFRASFKFKFAPKGHLEIPNEVVDTLINVESTKLFNNGLSRDGFTLPLLERADMDAKEMGGDISELLDWEAEYVAQLFNNELQKVYSGIEGSTDATHKHVNYTEPRF